MSVNVHAGGIFATKVGTEHILHTTTAPGVFVFHTNARSMRQGDVIELYVKTAVLSGHPIDTAFYASYTNSQFDPVKMSVPLTTVSTATYGIQTTSCGLPGSGVGSNGVTVGWSVLAIN